MSLEQLVELVGLPEPTGENMKADGRRELAREIREVLGGAPIGFSLFAQILLESIGGCQVRPDLEDICIARPNISICFSFKQNKLTKIEIYPNCAGYFELSS